MENRFDRTKNLIGEQGLSKLGAAKLLIVGLGGVGSYAAEAIARAGVGTIAVMDGDQVAESNLNRQLIALTITIGSEKAEVTAERIKQINPECNVTSISRYYKIGDELDLTQFDWIIDAIDDVEAKVELIKNAVSNNVGIISSMGTAGKFDTEFKISDISNTTVCPLAKKIRKNLREIGIEHLPVVYSEEKATNNAGTLGTLSYVPAVAGLKLAEYVIKEILK